MKFEGPVVLVGDAPFDASLIKEFAGLPIIAVDGGANACADAGIKPDYITGDFDSVRAEVLADLSDAQRLALPDQDFGDFEKTLSVVDATKIHALGFLSGRIDHSFEALRLLTQFHDKNIELIGSHERVFVWHSGGYEELPIGARISFCAFGACDVDISFGLEYPLDGLRLSANQMSLSNRVDEDEVSIAYNGAPLIAMVEW